MAAPGATPAATADENEVVVAATAFAGVPTMTVPLDVAATALNTAAVPPPAAMPVDPTPAPTVVADAIDNPSAAAIDGAAHARTVGVPTPTEHARPTKWGNAAAKPADPRIVAGAVTTRIGASGEAAAHRKVNKSMQKIEQAAHVHTH